MGTLALSTMMAVIGLALVGQAVSKAGVLSPRMILGVLFIAAGVLRVYLIVRRDRQA